MTLRLPIHHGKRHAEQNIRLGRMTSTRKPAPWHPAIIHWTQSDDGYAARMKDLFFIVTEALEEDGRWWLHVSVSRRDRKVPTYEDLKQAKRFTIGPDRVALQLFVPVVRHIDIAGKRERPVQVLHLWSPEEDFLPDFARGGNSI